MKNLTENHGRLFSRSIAAGLVLLLVLAGLPGWQIGWPPPTASAAWMVKPDGSKVQAVKPGTPTTVVLYKDQAPRGSPKITGYFHSATEDSITLERQDGQRHTFQKSAVRKVLKRRPIWKRYQGWTTAAISTAVLAPIPLSGTLKGNDTAIGTVSVLIALSTIIAFAVAPRKGGIYNVPRKLRTQPQGAKPSGSESKAPEKRGDSQ